MTVPFPCRFPISSPRNGRVGWGWAAQLLPYLEQNALAKEIDFTLNVEAASHLAVRTAVQRVFTCPTDRHTGVYTVLTERNNPLTPAATNSYAACFGAFGLR